MKFSILIIILVGFLLGTNLQVFAAKTKKIDPSTLDLTGIQFELVNYNPDQIFTNTFPSNFRIDITYPEGLLKKGQKINLNKLAEEMSCNFRNLDTETDNLFFCTTFSNFAFAFTNLPNTPGNYRLIINYTLVDGSSGELTKDFVLKRPFEYTISCLQSIDGELVYRSLSHEYPDGVLSAYLTEPTGCIFQAYNFDPAFYDSRVKISISNITPNLTFKEQRLSKKLIKIYKNLFQKIDESITEENAIAYIFTIGATQNIADGIYFNRADSQPNISISNFEINTRIHNKEKIFDSIYSSRKRNRTVSQLPLNLRIGLDEE